MVVKSHLRPEVGRTSIPRIPQGWGILGGEAHSSSFGKKISFKQFCLVFNEPPRGGGSRRCCLPEPSHEAGVTESCGTPYHWRRRPPTGRLQGGAGPTWTERPSGDGSCSGPARPASPTRRPHSAGEAFPAAPGVATATPLKDPFRSGAGRGRSAETIGLFDHKGSGST